MKIPANKKSLKRPAQGFVLLLIVLTMLAIAGVVFLNGVGTSLSGSQRQVAQAQAANDVLMAAKAALLGYVVQTADGLGGRLGNLPMPDILNAAGSAIQYDGYGDGPLANKCLASNVPNGVPGVISGTSAPANFQRCIGKFPWLDFNLDIGNPATNDPVGQVPWLAISGNLNAWDTCLPKLNSDALNWPFAASSSCPSAPNTIPYPWLKVIDQNGVINDRVVAVLIMPGPPIETEGRTQSRLAPHPNISEYLDAISLPLGCVSSCTGTYDNADLSNVFVQIPLGTKYPTNAENAALAGQIVKFNDVLVYITIDELMPYLEKRVLSEMSAAVKDSKSKTGTYPWAAAFSNPTDYSNSKFMTTPGTPFGLFPFFESSNHTPYQSNFDWKINSVSPPGKVCVPVQASPNRFVDINQHLKADFYLGGNNFGSASGASSTCEWNEIPTVTKDASLICNYSDTSSLPNKSFILYTNSACTTIASGGLPISPKSYTVSRTVTAIIDAKCRVNVIPPLPNPLNKLTTSYQPADNIYAQRLTWACANVKSGVFTVTGSDTITVAMPPPMPVGTFSEDGVGKNVTVSNLRYQPIMPTWFYNNDWYLTAFYAVAPSKAPSPVTPCGITTQLSAGANSGGDAIVMLAGSRLPNLPAVPTQMRPSPSLDQYLESPNLTAGTNCVFSPSGITTTPTSNDQVLVISP